MASTVLVATSTVADTTPPVLTLTSPVASTLTTAARTLAITGTTTDDVGVIQVIWASDRGGMGTAIGTSPWAISSVPLQTGVNKITVTARDAGGNQTAAVLTVTSTGQDAVSIAITAPTSQPIFSASDNTINLGGIASNSATKVTWVSDQGLQGQATGTSIWTTGAIPLRNGTNRITMVARDAAGNQSTTAIVVVFKAPAILTDFLPAAQAGKPYSFQLTATGGTPPYQWFAVPVPNGLMVTEEGLIAGTPMVSGSFALNIAVRDSARAETTTSIGLQIDNWLVLASAASLQQGPVAAESMVAAFGWQLADSVESATASPLPTKLGATTVTVRDANGMERPSALYYVSPSQINFTIPANTAVGPATITVRSGNQSRALGNLNIVAVAPALFFLNQDRLAAAGVVRVRGDAQTYESIATFDSAANQLVAVPIDLGPEGDQVYLTLYGTGLRLRTTLESVHVFVGSVLVPVVYAGPSGIFDNLDLVNVLLPRGLRGAGSADIFLEVNGATANTVRVVIR